MEVVADVVVLAVPLGQAAGTVGNREWVFDHPFFIILNLAVGGTLGGTIGLDTGFPAYLYVDYVRVYQPVAGTDS